MDKVIESNSDRQVVKRAEFEAFRLWRTLPALLRFPPKSTSGDRPLARDFALSLGIDDADILALLDLKTQKDFADRFEVDEDTLTAWNKKLDARDDMGDLRRWSKRLSKNVLLALYNHAVTSGHPGNFKLYFQLVNKWSEKVTHEHEFKGVARVNVKQDVERIAPPVG